MTFDDRLRKLTDDIGRGKDERLRQHVDTAHGLRFSADFPSIGRAHEVDHQAQVFQHEVTDLYLWLEDCGHGFCPSRGPCAVAVPLASDAMAERDENGEVKGVMF